MDWDWVALGAALRARREVLRLTRPELGELAGVHAATIKNYEGGSKAYDKIPKSVTLLEGALGWKTGSAQAVLEGGEPTVVAATASRVEEQRFVRTQEGTYDLIRDLLRGIVGAVAPDTPYSKFLEAEEKALEIAERHGLIVRPGHTGEQSDKASGDEDANRT